MKSFLFPLLLILLTFSCKQRSSETILVTGIIENYSADSISVYFYQDNMFNPVFPRLKVPVLNRRFSFQTTLSLPTRITLSLGERLIPAALVYDSDVSLSVNFNSPKGKFDVRVKGKNYDESILDSIDFITISPPHKFEPFNYYKDFIQIASSFASTITPIDSLVSQVAKLAKTMGARYKKLYDDGKIEKWFYEYRIKEIKANILYELMENLFGLNLTDAKYESEEETELLKDIHNRYSFKDSLKVWNNFIKYSKVTGLNSLFYIQYRFLFMQSYLTPWIDKNEFNKLSDNPEKYITTSARFPVNLSLSQDLIQLRIAEIVRGMQKRNDTVDQTSLMKLQKWFKDDKFIIALATSPEKNDYYKTKSLSYSVLDISRNPVFADAIKKNFTGNVVLVDIWAHWCSPCIEEFSKENFGIDNFIQENNVKRFYVAVGNKGTNAYNKVMRQIKQYKLNGIHIFADSIFQKSILDTVFEGNEQMPIPRYVIIDKNNKIVNFNAPRPSHNSGKSLIDSLRRYL